MVAVVKGNKFEIASNEDINRMRKLEEKIVDVMIQNFEYSSGEETQLFGCDVESEDMMYAGN
jgi:hypothetical protein